MNILSLLPANQESPLSSLALLQALNQQSRLEHGLPQQSPEPLEQLGGRTRGRFREFILDSAFQPIYEVHSGELFAFEALLRAENTQGQSFSPEAILQIPETKREIVFLDRLCRTVHVFNYLNQATHELPLFLNLDPRHVLAVAHHGLIFEDILRQTGLPAQQVVIELLETASEDFSSLKQAVQNFRNRGFQIAIDDFGRGHANFDRLWDLEPDFVKFDRLLLTSATQDPRLAEVLPKLVDVTKARGTRVLFEGIETEQELALAQTSGGDLLQGFLLGHPHSLCTSHSNVALMTQKRTDT